MTNIEPRPEVQARAVDSLFQIFEEMKGGAVSADRNARIFCLLPSMERTVRRHFLEGHF
ncbi:MAG: hypothetical protein AAF495_14120 [Pseudomonadota bacterium]